MLCKAIIKVYYFPARIACHRVSYDCIHCCFRSSPLWCSPRRASAISRPTTSPKLALPSFAACDRCAASCRAPLVCLSRCHPLFCFTRPTTIVLRVPLAPRSSTSRSSCRRRTLAPVRAIDATSPRFWSFEFFLLASLPGCGLFEITKIGDEYWTYLVDCKVPTQHAPRLPARAACHKPLCCFCSLRTPRPSRSCCAAPAKVRPSSLQRQPSQPAARSDRVGAQTS